MPLAPRAQGINARHLLGWETAYGVPDFTTSYKFPFTAGNSLSPEQPLLENPLLGFGNDPADAILDVENLSGDIPVPVDMRYYGFWLTALTGEPVTSPVAATGRITFPANPAVGQTITINGTVFTFDDEASTGSYIEVKGSAILTVAEIVSVLNASANANVDDATYSQSPGEAILIVTHDTAGPAGNSFTLAASHAKVSAATLQGGAYQHLFSSGNANVPSFWVERGFTDIQQYQLLLGLKLNALRLSFSRSGIALSTLNILGQKAEEYVSTSVDANPEEPDVDMVSNFKGVVKSNGVVIGNLISAQLSIGNNLDPIGTVGTGGLLSGADKTVASFTGDLGIRFHDTDFITLARSGGTLPLELGFNVAPGFSLSIDAPRVKLPVPKQPIEGPGGIESTFAFQGSKDPVSGKMYTIKLVNDMDGTDYLLPEA